MTESNFRRRVNKILMPLHAIAIENSIARGTPDVNYAEGWIELKFAKTWPKGDKTPLRLDHFTQEQRLWLRRRWNKGGKAHLFLQVNTDFLIFDGITAFEHVGKGANKSLLFDLAEVKWENGLNEQEFLEWARKPR